MDINSLEPKDPHLTPGPRGPDPAIASGASWLYWIAGLSLITIIVQLSGGQFGFALSLGVAEVIASVGKMAGGVVSIFAIAASVTMIVGLGALGYFASKGAVWAFVTGIVLLLLDTLLLLLGLPQSVISVVIHLWAVFSLFKGMQAARDA